MYEEETWDLEPVGEVMASPTHRLLYNIFIKFARTVRNKKRYNWLVYQKGG